MSQALISTSRLDAPSAAIVAASVELLQDDAAGVVHDLGNLIQIAASALNIIARSPRLGTGALEPVIARAKTSLERAGALVHQTLGRVARTATVTTLSEQVSLREALDEIGSLLAYLCEPHIALSIHVERDLPDVSCCRLDLQNAILNLVLNARDAMPEGGAITIRACGLGSAAAPVGVLLRVIDNGAGMSSATIQRAFDPFFTTKGERGSGMGLAMVRRFTEAAGGSVSIDSQPGVGATVTLRLPGAPDPDWSQAFESPRQDPSRSAAG